MELFHYAGILDFMNYCIVQGDTIRTNCVRNAACKSTVQKYCDGRNFEVMTHKHKMDKINLELNYTFVNEI